MSNWTKNIVRKGLYLIFFVLMAGAFVYLSEKYANNSEIKIQKISDYYSNLNENVFEVVRGQQLISLLKSGKHLVFIGSKTSLYSIKYIEELNKILDDGKIDKIYYYDLNNDKGQKNSNYYAIRDLLSGYLITTDGSQNNLLAPSFYIVDNGKVKYYNIDTVAMKNTDSIDTFWTKEQELVFKTEIMEAIDKYYLN